MYADCGEAVTQAVRVTARIDPVPEWVDVYRARRERFTELYPALAPFREGS
jgi:sugar (pentulose or hexulose) kinase